MGKNIFITIFVIFMFVASIFIAYELGKATYPKEINEEQKSPYHSTKIDDFFSKRTTYSSNGYYIDCSGFDLQLTAMCLNYYVNIIFNYTLTDDSLELTDNDLKTIGGDCKDWSEFYAREFEKYGYKTQTERVDVKKPLVEDGVISENGKDHMILIVSDWNESGYCLMDMTQYQCYGYQDIVTIRDYGSVVM